MKTSKTALAAAAFGVAAMVVPVEAEETKRNFSFELQNREVAADSRRSGERSLAAPSAHPGGPEVGELSWEQFKRWWEVDFVNWWRYELPRVGRKPGERAWQGPAAIRG